MNKTVTFESDNGRKLSILAENISHIGMYSKGGMWHVDIVYKDMVIPFKAYYGGSAETANNAADAAVAIWDKGLK